MKKIEMKSKMKKRYVSLLVALLLVLGVTACKKEDNTNEVTPTPTTAIQEEVTPTEVSEENVTPTITETAAEPTKEVDAPITEKKHAGYEIKEETLVQSMKDETGKVNLYNVSVRYPQIVSKENRTTITNINEAIAVDAKNKLQQMIDANKQLVMDSYKDMLDSNLTELAANFPYSSEITYEVEFNKNYLLSILYTEVTNIGGPYPNVMQSSGTYDVVTGAEIEAIDILKMTQQEINDMVAQTFTTIINEEPEGFFEDARDIVTKEAENAGFYLAEENIVFYYNEGIIGPHARGTVEFGLAYGPVPDFYNEPDRFE